jgi:hypothetical protein
MPYKFEPMDETTAAHIRSGGADAYGNPPERKISDGQGVPCRRCLGMVAAGDSYLVFAWRPFTRLHAYAETGPVFIHADHCTPPVLERGGIPVFLESPDYILRGYDRDEKIVYGSGGVVPRGSIPDRIMALLCKPDIESVHIRSSRNNCYHCRVVRQD